MSPVVGQKSARSDFPQKEGVFLIFWALVWERERLLCHISWNMRRRRDGTDDHLTCSFNSVEIVFLLRNCEEMCAMTEWMGQNFVFFSFVYVYGMGTN